MLFAIATTAIAKDSTLNARTYAALTFEGGAHDGDEPSTTLLKHFSLLIEHARAGKEKPKIEFQSLTLDLMTPGATMQTKLADLAMQATFVPQDADANEFRAQMIRRETTLTADVFNAIIADLQRVDAPRRKARVAGRWSR